MFRRVMDLVLVAIVLPVAVPIVALSAVAVRLSSPGPAFFKAVRVGRDRRLFTMYKLRTMHCRQHAGSSITAAEDPRVFPVGRILRALKIDELPQLWNILSGDMAVVGPRPEAPDIVDGHYTEEYLLSLSVAPGLTSPGSVYYYTVGERILESEVGDAEELYVQRLLPEKMKLDLEYMRRATFLSDLNVIAATARILLKKVIRRRHAPQNDQPASVGQAPA